MYIEIEIQNGNETISNDGIYIPDVSNEYADYILMSLLVKAFETAYIEYKKEADQD